MSIGDLITWSTFVIGLPAVAVWLWRTAELSTVWRAARIAWLRAYVAYEARHTAVAPSSPQTDGQTDQTDGADAPADPAPGRTELLTLYRLLRDAGVTREAARPALRGVGIAIDNNLWSEARPPAPAAAAEQAVTPFGGRSYDPAAYHTDDPHLQYREPPA